MSNQWIVSNPRRKAPSVPLPLHPVFQTWESHIGKISPSTGDYEYFVEEVFRLHAAVTSFGAENIWLAEFSGENGGQAKNLNTGEWKSIDELAESGAGFYGALPGTVHTSWAFQAIDDYCTLETFKKNAGRVTGLGGFADREDETSSIEDTLAVIKEAGANGALLKRRKAKLPLIPVDLKDWEPGVSVISCVGPDDGWALINDEGRPNIYLVQEVIPMRYEYRLFVIGGKLVTGAGCIEEFTPLDNEGEVFDARVREDRFYECPSPVVSRPDVVGQYLHFADKVIAELKAENPELDRYVLDVALSKNDEPVIIEFNSESNAGLYASRPDLITDALARTK